MAGFVEQTVRSNPTGVKTKKAAQIKTMCKLARGVKGEKERKKKKAHNTQA
jgi:hypothetical protein